MELPLVSTNHIGYAYVNARKSNNSLAATVNAAANACSHFKYEKDSWAESLKWVRSIEYEERHNNPYRIITTTSSAPAAASATSQHKARLDAIVTTTCDRLLATHRPPAQHVSFWQRLRGATL